MKRKETVPECPINTAVDTSAGTLRGEGESPTPRNRFPSYPNVGDRAGLREGKPALNLNTKLKKHIRGPFLYFACGHTDTKYMPCKGEPEPGECEPCLKKHFGIDVEIKYYDAKSK